MKVVAALASALAWAIPLSEEGVFENVEKLDDDDDESGEDQLALWNGGDGASAAGHDEWEDEPSDAEDLSHGLDLSLDDAEEDGSDFGGLVQRRRRRALRLKRSVRRRRRTSRRRSKKSSPYDAAVAYHKALGKYRKRQAFAAQRHAYAAQAWREYARAVQQAKMQQAASQGYYQEALNARSAVNGVPPAAMNAPFQMMPSPQQGVSPPPRGPPNYQQQPPAPQRQMSLAPPRYPAPGGPPPPNTYVDTYFTAARARHQAQLEAAQRAQRSLHTKKVHGNYFYRGAMNIFQLRTLAKKAALALKLTKEDAAWLEQQVKSARAAKAVHSQECNRAKVLGTKATTCSKTKLKKLGLKVTRGQRMLKIVQEEVKRLSHSAKVLKAQLYASEMQYFGANRMRAKARKKARAAEIEAAVAPLRKQLAKLKKR
mmetsp:Transcript_56298/g.123295  ORF Transcript_56298/g.123295 Transcript_56298/m.123295 type:complete len:427 (+) Transcript_56298:121-1401(+)|eukprot:CAMPEP_0204266900 /NCGR_PEP_ID=MMETSP0468-20130131/10612_1 /ASSEMBLY_ACC=CAM_ASM_000383 /TAXON_ID=2969 /ORGANISM="Oxyrrhis marina" /LENGTH=426 /DNA_ID=CAMNT_0051242017 /DNA_START=92 /DNA_END=1372 /DNA_ORIENTATION=+